MSPGFGGHPISVLSAVSCVVVVCCSFVLICAYPRYPSPETHPMRLLAGTAYDRPPTCDRCGRPESECRCPPEVIPKSGRPPDKKPLKLSVEKRKKGKVV